jgi:NAD(P)H-flavin reductase
VIELQLRKDDFHFKPGQYLFLNMPYLSSQVSLSLSFVF